MRLLMICPYPPQQDGIGHHASELLAALPSDIESHVLTTGPAALAEEPTIETIAVHRLGQGNPVLPVRAWSLVRRLSPDVVHMHFAVSLLGTRYVAVFVAGLMARRRLGVPVVITDHEVVRDVDTLGPFGTLLHGRLAALVDVVVVYSDEAKSVLTERCGVDAAKVIVVPHGMTPRLTTHEAPGSGRALFCTFGFIQRDKGIDILLDAVGLLRADALCPPFEVIVSGSVRARRGIFRLFGRADRKYAREIDQIIRNDLADIVSRRPFLPETELYHMLHRCRAFVAPYRRTTQSGAVNRAAGAGSAIVASDLPGLRASLGDAALWFEVGNPLSLANALRRLLADPSETDRLRAASRKALESQSMEATAAIQAELWRRLVKEAMLT
jgi:glycosyltransferase involved in cell wall biosynthesis